MLEKLPTIPAVEYPKRWEMVKELMSREGLDLLIVYSDDRCVFGPAYARWLADLFVHFEPVCILFTPKSDPIMLIGPESVGYVKIHSQIKDIRILKEFEHPDQDFPYTKFEWLVDIVSDFVDPKLCKKIGIAGRSLISYDLFSEFKKILPGEWVTVDDQMDRMRGVKSPAEIEVMKYAYKIAEAGLQAGVSAVEAGVPERMIAAEMEYVMRKMGVECYGIDTMVAGGEHTSPIYSRTTMRKIAKDDLVMLLVAPRYEGYHGALAVPVLVGNPSDEAKRAVDAAIRAQEACAAMMKDGQTNVAEAEARRVMEEGGFGEGFAYAGIHSIGVVEFEAPIFGPTSKDVMKENMILSIDIPVFHFKWGGLRLEDGYIIEKSGAKRLTSFDYLIEK